MALSGKSVENKKFTHVFKAARWSASGFNEHPWPFSAGSKGKGQAATDILPDKLKKNELDFREGKTCFCRTLGPTLQLRILGNGKR